MRDTTYADNILAKTPAEEVFFHFDWTKRLLEGETITGTPVVTASPAGLTLGTPTVDGAKVQVSIKLGTAGLLYTLKCKIATSLSQAREISGYLVVE